jgi:enoyl-CoA hydratase/carnithine racemase
MTDSIAPASIDLLLHQCDARGVHRLTLNSPASFNTLSEAMLDALQKALNTIAQCDLAVSVDSASFGVNGIDVGLFCATPSVPLVRNMHTKQAMEMLLTGGFISAEEARSRGLVKRVCVAAELDAQVDALVSAILSKPREAVRLGKALFYKQREMGVAAAYQLAGQTMACNRMDDVAQKGVQAFIDKRKPSWRA